MTTIAFILLISYARQLQTGSSSGRLSFITNVIICDNISNGIKMKYFLYKELSLFLWLNEREDVI